MRDVTRAASPPARGNRLLRLLFRLPVALYRRRLGWLLGNRFVLVTHLGRRSGRRYRTVLEVVRYDRTTRECLVVSGFGLEADWYRNIWATPAVWIETGRVRYAPRQRFLDADERLAELTDYRRRHPWAARLLLPWLARQLGLEYGESAAAQRPLAAALPMVLFRPS